MFKSIRSAFVFALLLGGAVSVNAQQPAPPPEPEMDSAPARPVSQEKVESFAAAYGAVQSIQEEYTERLQQTDDREKAQALQQEAQQKMMAAVEGEDVTVEEYNEMIGRMDQDPDLRRRVFSIVMEE